jgi:hypothetical protein
MLKYAILADMGGCYLKHVPRRQDSYTTAVRKSAITEYSIGVSVMVFMPTSAKAMSILTMVVGRAILTYISVDLTRRETIDIYRSL